jgi:hypothetical protein
MYVEKFLASLAEAMNSTENDQHRRMLGLAIQHVEGEHVKLNIDSVMATLVPEPHYGFYGFGDGTRAPQGGAEVRAFYEAFGNNLLGDVDMEVENLIVGDTGVVIEGVFIYSAEYVRRCYPDVKLTVDPSIPAVLRRRTCLIMPFNGELMTGEIAYVDGPLSEAEVVEYGTV